MFNWQIRTELHHFKNEGRLAILVCMVLHKNTRNRAYPSVQTLAKETGYKKTAIVAGVQWLLDHYALIPVAYEYRAGDEKKLHKRRNIYQVTGVIELEGKFHRYLHMNPEQWSGVLEEINAISKGSDFEPLKVHISELQNSEPQEGISNSSKGIPKKGVSRKSAKGSKTPTIPAEQMNPMKDALVEAFGWKWELMTQSEKGLIQVTAKELCTVNFAPDRVASLHAWCKAKFTDFSPRALVGHLSEYRAAQLNSASAAPTVPRKETMEEAKKRLGVTS